MTLRIVIADDEGLARDRLRRLLEEEPDVRIVAECSNGAQTLEAVRQHAPDVVMMDVRMPELDAFQVIEALGPELTQAVILVTAHDQFAVRAFSTRTVDYLLKPFDRERLSEALRRARAMVERNRKGAVISAVLEKLRLGRPSPRAVDRLPVKSNGRILLVNVGDIGWIRSSNNYCELHVGGVEHLLRQNLTKLEQLLPAGQFVRISRSLMVNLEAIQELRIKSHGDLTLILRDGAELTASRNYREHFLARLGRQGEAF